MTGTKGTESKNSLFYAVSIVSLVAICFWYLADFNSSTAKVGKSDSNNFAPSATFPGTGVGPIPDATCGVTNLEVSFAVTGIPGPPGNVEVNMTFNPAHTYAGDVDMEVVSPNGIRHWVQSYTGGQGGDFGDGSDMAGPYTFKDSAPSVPTWWTAAFLDLNGTIPAGSYRTQAPGPFANDDPGPPITNMTAAFANIPTSNGTWKLVVGDCAGGDTGSISVANLTIAPKRKKNVDMDGDGKTDFVQTRSAVTLNLTNGEPRPVGKSIREREQINMDSKFDPMLENLGGAPPTGTSTAWYTNRSGNGTDTSVGFGNRANFNDHLTPADYDGDGKVDIAFWRGISTGNPSQNAFFYILNSGNSTVSIVDFGQLNDDPGIVGDYDGDQKADPAVFRCPTAVAGQCFFYFKGSNNNPGGNITYVPWGHGRQFNTIFASPGDFDGDGKFDFQVQTDGGANQGLFILRRSSDFGITYTYFGRPTDNIAPGDYDGDGKDDIALVRITAGNLLTWYVKGSAGGGQQIQWGLSTDWITQGDYDGDGKTDLAVFRPGTNPDNNYFYVYQSGTGTLKTYEYGIQTDVPAANWNVH